MRRDQRRQAAGTEEQEQGESEGQEASLSAAPKGAVPPVQAGPAKTPAPTASERAYGGGAAAYTSGNSIALGESESGEMQAHEATHVVQQRGR